MSIAIIIATHGQAARPLLDSAEMLIGAQENIATVTFVAGENRETLVEKYRQILTQLKTDQGVLFLVDTWGGSPFNAAAMLAQESPQYQIIAGLSIPLLIETLMCRDDNPSLQSLVQVAIHAGREAVRAYSDVTDTSTPVMIPSAIDAPENTSTSPASLNRTEHMIIALARIDDRLIHGQVATRWTKETNVSRIIVVSDQVAADPVRKTLLTQVAPPGVTAHVVNIAKMIRVFENPQYSGERVMLLFTQPSDVLRLVEEGVDIRSVNIGGMAYQQGKTQVTNAVSLNAQDISAFQALAARGIELEIRKVASDSPVKMGDLLKKLS